MHYDFQRHFDINSLLAFAQNKPNQYQEGKIPCTFDRWSFHSCAEWFDLHQNLRSPDTVQCTHPFTDMMVRQTRTRRTWKNQDEFKVCKHYKYFNLHNLGSRLPQQSKHCHGFGCYSHLAGILLNNYHHCHRNHHHHHNSVLRLWCQPCHLKRRVAIGSELVAALSPATPPV